MRRMFVNSLIFFVLLSLYGTVYGSLLAYRQQLPPQHKESFTTWTLPPQILKIAAGEFKGLIADLIALDAGSRLGAEMIRTPDGNYKIVRKEYDWDIISRLFFNSQALDPSFQQTYMVAQGWLPWDADMVKEANDILKTAAENRPWDWRPLHLMGFNNYYFLNRPGEAGKLFLEAAKTPNAPPFLPILGARLAQKGGETQTAISIMKSMLIGKKKSEPGYKDIVDRLQALEGVLILEKASGLYQKEVGALPPDVEALLAKGILTELPQNPYNIPYCIDAEGKIYFDKPLCKNQPGK